MAEPSLTSVFGAGATQDASSLTIQKADLTALGLTPSATNSAEALFAAIVANAQTALTQEGFNTNLDQSIVISDGLASIVSRDNGAGTFVGYRQRQLNVNLHKLDDDTFSADDY